MLNNGRCIRRAAACFAAIFAIVVLVGRGEAQSVPQINQVVSETIRRLDLQSALPHEAPGWFFPDIPLPRELVWIPVIGGVAMLIYYVVTRLPFSIRGRPARNGLAAAEKDAAADSPTASTVAEADELAHQGRFGEAMHLMLLQGLAALREMVGERLADSLTSREILARTGLSEPGRTLLSEIVGRVEKSHFGHFPTSREDYLACRKKFEGLMQALQQSGARG